MLFLGENYERLLKLAYKLEVAYVISQCEEFLMHTKGISQVKKLFYAEKYKLSKLQVSFTVLVFFIKCFFGSIVF